MASNNRPKLCCPQPRDPAERSRARTMFEAGASYREINETVGTPISTLRVWCKRDAWKIAKPDVAIVPTELAETDVPDTLQEAAEEYERNLRRASVIVSRRIAQMQPDEVVQKADRIKQIDSTARKALRIETEKPFQVIQIGVLAQPVKVRSAGRDRLGAPKQLLRADEPETLTLDAEVSEPDAQ